MKYKWSDLVLECSTYFKTFFVLHAAKEERKPATDMIPVPAAWGDWRMFAATSKRQGTWGGEMEMKRRWGRAWQAAEGEESGCGAEPEDDDWGRELSNKASRQTEGSSRHQPTCRGGTRPLQGRLPAVKVWFFLPPLPPNENKGSVTQLNYYSVSQNSLVSGRTEVSRESRGLCREMCDFFFLLSSKI